MVRVVRLIRGGLAILGAVILVTAAFEAINWVSVQMLRYRLEPQYAIARQVRKGMRYDEAQALIGRYRTREVAVREFPPDAISVWVQYSLRDTCYTTLQFRGGTLVSTRTSGEDSPDDYCPGSPPDVR
jgi:hypothetical protein